MKCDKCDAQSWRVTEKFGSIEAWECNQCGNQISVHVNDPGIGDSASRDFLHMPDLKGVVADEAIQRNDAGNRSSIADDRAAFSHATSPALCP